MDVGLVCDGCGAFNELGISVCVSCGGAVSLDAVSPDTPSPESPSGKAAAPSSAQNAAPELPGSEPCATCDAPIAFGNRFCGACGTPVGTSIPQASSPSPNTDKSRKTLFFSNIQEAKAKLVLIKGEGHDGESYTLAGDDHHIGRTDGDIVFDEDEFLSPLHANFFYDKSKLVVGDQNSTNGVYLRIRTTTKLEHNDFFLVGEQVMQVHLLDPPGELAPTEDGTYLYASPRKPAAFELLQVLSGGAAGIQMPVANDTISLGREDSDINFPDDPFISGRHAQVSMRGGVLTLSDLDSKNGTFVRLTKETPLSHGDYVFMGQQLLRVEIV